MLNYFISGTLEQECDIKTEVGTDPFIFYQASDVEKAFRPVIKAVIGWSLVCEDLSRNIQVSTCCRV